MSKEGHLSLANLVVGLQSNTVARLIQNIQSSGATHGQEIPARASRRAQP